MANNALTGLATPASPQIAPQQPQGGAPPGGPPPGGPPPGGAPQMPQQPPAPTHAQAVTGLRHYDRILRVLERLKADPALGKTDMKSKFIDGVTRLAADRIISTSDAVEQLSTVPTDPLEQLKWVQTHFQNAVMAENAILQHHSAANPGSGNYIADLQQHPPGNPEEDHMENMGGLMGHYGKPRAPVAAVPSPKLKNALKAA